MSTVEKLMRLIVVLIITGCLPLFLWIMTLIVEG